MATCTTCQTAQSFTGDFKSQSSSLTFLMCDGGGETLVPAETVGDYIINNIYNDASGNPPAEGCYAVCFDSNGVRTTVDTATQAELNQCKNDLQNQINDSNRNLQGQIDNISDNLSGTEQVVGPFFVTDNTNIKSVVPNGAVVTNIEMGYSVGNNDNVNSLTIIYYVYYKMV